MRKGTLKGILIAAVIIVLIVAVVVVASRLERRSEWRPSGAGTSTVVRPTAGPDVSTVNFDGKEYKIKDGLSTLLVLGTDDIEVDEDEGYLVDSQADFVVLAVLNSGDRTCKLLQIDRNTMTYVDANDENGVSIGKQFMQLCLSHAYGYTPESRCENTVRAVSSLLYNVPIDNYISLTMGGIVALNDAVGGVTVTIEDNFEGIDDTLVEGETVTLLGEHAYNFVHSRMTMVDDSSNVARMRRHRVYIEALGEKLKSQADADSGFLMDVYSAVDDYMVSDCTVDELSDFNDSFSEYTMTGIVTLEGQNEHNEHTEFYPDEEKLMQTVLDLFYDPVAAD